MNPVASHGRWLAIAGLTLLASSCALFFAAFWHHQDAAATWKDTFDACSDAACRDALGPAPRLSWATYASFVAATLVALGAVVFGMATTPRQTPQERRQRREPVEDPALARRFLLGASLGLVVAGVLARLTTPWFMRIGSDGGNYAAIANGIATTGTMTLPWGDVWTSAHVGAEASHHYPPLYPLWVAGFYKMAGFGVWQTQLASITMSLAALAVVFFATRNLFGRVSAWVTTGLVAVQSRLVWVTGAGFSENLTIALFTLTLWGILRSINPSLTPLQADVDPLRAKVLRQERDWLARYNLRWPRRSWAIVLAGLFAGLSYLTRSTMGVFFLVAGLGGFAWRFWFMRWDVLRQKPYLVAIAAFALTAGTWVARNLLVFGWPNWQGSAYNGVAQDYAFAHPTQLAVGLVLKGALFAGFLGLYALWFWPELREARKTWKTEATSCLLLGVGLVFLIGWILSAIYWTYEAYPIWWLDNERYAVVAIVPLFWLVCRHAKATRSFAIRTAAAGLVFLAITMAVVGQTGSFPDGAAAASLPLQAGDTVGYEGNVAKYSFYTYLPRQDVATYQCHGNATTPCMGNPPFILTTLTAKTYPGYAELARFEAEGTTAITLQRVTQ